MRHVGRAGLLVLSAGIVVLAASTPRSAELHAASGVQQMRGSAGRGGPATQSADQERDVERIRAATARFKSLDSAVAAGYPRTVSHCLAKPPEGGMGYHLSHPDLMDAKIELERPEILTYARTPSGDFELTGVEYVIPLNQWSAAEAPTVMGQKMKRAPSLGIWYLHVWVWRSNPKGLFADWNPRVEC